MTHRPAILFRTHLHDAPVAALAARLQAETGMPLIYVVDEAWGPVPLPPGSASVRMDPAALRGLGLALPPRFGWLCGDYGFYLARAAFPEFTHFWLVEYDVHVAAPDLGAFFAPFAEDPGCDLIAGYLFPRDVNWPNTLPMLPFAARVWGTLFPFLRVSARAVDHMLQRRRAISALHDAGQLAAFPNDEAFAATVLMEEGLQGRDLNDFGSRVYVSEDFRFGAPRSLRQVPADGRLHHPVMGGLGLFQKASQILHVASTLEEAAAMAAHADAIGEECGAEAAAAFAASVAAAKARLGGG